MKPTETTPSAKNLPVSIERRYDMDALRGIAMSLGIVLHGTLSFIPNAWPAEDIRALSDGEGFYDEILSAIHGFRMQLFFLLSGFFTSMVWRRRGAFSLIRQRFKRIVLPLILGCLLIVPSVDWASEKALNDSYDDRDQFYSQDLWGPIIEGQDNVIKRILSYGVSPNIRGDDNWTPLHIAILLNEKLAVQYLLASGADATAKTDLGITPIQFAIWNGDQDIANWVIAAGGSIDLEPVKNWASVDSWGQRPDELNQAISSIRSDDPFSLHHLWFLWFLCWFVFAYILAIGVRNIRNRIFPSLSKFSSLRRGAISAIYLIGLLGVSFLCQLQMSDKGNFRSFGPDTSTSFKIPAHLFLYYLSFFAFGAVLFSATRSKGKLLIDDAYKIWMIPFPALLVLFPFAKQLTGDLGQNWAVISVFQISYTWIMTLGLIGLSQRYLSKKRERVRWFSDSAYWLYLAHITVLILAQSWIRNVELPGPIKLTGLCFVTTVVLLVSYQLFVRYTPIGWLLNGKRKKLRYQKDASLAVN